MGLQAGLLLVGVVLIVGVIVISKWSEWTSKIKAKKARKPTHRHHAGEAPVLTDRVDASESRLFEENAEPSVVEEGAHQGTGRGLDDRDAEQSGSHLFKEVKPFDDRASAEEQTQRGAYQPPAAPQSAGELSRAKQTDGLSPSHERNAAADNQAVEHTEANQQQTVGAEQKVAEGLKSEVGEEADQSPFVNLRQIDYWVKLTGRSRHNSDELRGLIAADLQLFNAEVVVHGMALPDMQWLDLMQGDEIVEFKDIVIAIQLVNDGQALLLGDLMKFEAWAKRLAEQLQSETYFVATVEEAAAQAADLQRFVAECRGALEVAVVSADEHGFSGRLIASSAKQQGMEFDAGRLVRFKAMGKTTVALYEAVQLDGQYFPADMAADITLEGVRFRMIPALTQKPGRVAKEMLDAIKVFNSRVSGNIMIPGYDEFHQEQITDLINHLSKLENRMIDAGVEPGGAQASRIF